MIELRQPSRVKENSFIRRSCAVCENAAAASETLICVSHLTDSASLAELYGVMESAGVSTERRAVFHAHLTHFNACAMLHEGYRTVSTASPCYDPYLLQDMWSAAHPDFIGHNCRITAFSLMGDAISIADTENPNVANLFMDQQALQEDTSAMLSDADLPRFLALFL